MATRTRGGKKLDAFLRKAKTAKGVNAVEIGFYSTAKYPDGTAVTNVAFYNEFGTDGKDGVGAIPERPFMRQSIAKFPDQILPVLKADVDPRTMVVTRRTASKVGLVGQGIIQRQIVLLREPPNAESTIENKKSSNPLVDTAFMKSAVTWLIVD